MMVELLPLLLAALSPLCMTLGFFVWQDSWKGSAFALNMFKCSVGGFLFLLISLSIRNEGFRLASQNKAEVLYPLILSSLYGIIIGDFAWLYALGAIGARRVILVDSIKPGLAVISAHIFLSETFSLITAIGGVLSCAGVLMVCLEQHNMETKIDEQTTDTGTEIGIGTGINQAAVEMSSSHNLMHLPPDSAHGEEKESQSAHVENEVKVCPGTEMEMEEQTVVAPNTTGWTLVLGYTAAVINVTLDVYGSVLTKQSGPRLNTFEINSIRFGFAGALMMVLSVVMSIVMQVFAGGRPPSPAASPWFALPSFQVMSASLYAKVIGGVLLVTFITPALSNYALFFLPLGLALTLGSLGPLYALIFAMVMRREHVTRQAVVGTVVTVLGVSMLCWNL